MRTVLAVLVAVTSVLTAPSPADAGRPTVDLASDLVRVEQLLYATPIDVFVTVVSAGLPGLDTSTDYCSAPLVGSTGRSFDFRAPCRRHDFGYRNLKLLDQRSGRPGSVWNGVSRWRVDLQLLADMRAHCAARAWWDRVTCRSWAWTFYVAVRTAGGA